jgi:hypothetical protein
VQDHGPRRNRRTPADPMLQREAASLGLLNRVSSGGWATRRSRRCWAGGRRCCSRSLTRSWQPASSSLARRSATSASRRSRVSRRGAVPGQSSRSWPVWPTASLDRRPRAGRA